MIEIRPTARALADVEMFVERLRESFRNFYSDTGIPTEQEIHKNYRENLRELYREIMSDVLHCLRA